MHTKAPDIAIPTRCQSCQAELKFPLVCTSCRQLHPLRHDLDLFRLMGLPAGFDIELDDLKARFLEISRYIHPDRFSAADVSTQLEATRMSARLNEAMTTLSDPLARAEYLLQLAGGPDAIADRTVPQDVLTGVLMIREEIEEAKDSRDIAALEGIRKQVAQLDSEGMQRVAALAKTLPGGSEDSRKALRRELNSVKYYQKLRAELEAMTD